MRWSVTGHTHVLLQYEQLEMLLNAISYELHNNELTADYKADLESLAHYLEQIAEEN
jgi:hypothetical protein